MDEIQRKRKVMIESAKENGFTDEMTIQYSQELDELIVAYQKARQTASQYPNRGGNILLNWRLARTNNRERLAVSAAI
ncbi:aspartyl-phosphate phosphatase Spo0E family protein [Neobacillus piezotolerans]|nr:aspartyl-phosphate phosphatase Spo0E family protein [Neobacillus piezotolerans]